MAGIPAPGDVRLLLAPLPGVGPRWPLSGEILAPILAFYVADEFEGAIVGGDNYGQGSSREHAALCPMFLGVRAVVAKSIERIHTANLINVGILPLTFANPAGHPPGAFGIKKYVIWNIREGMSEPGQWFLDRAKATDKKHPNRDHVLFLDTRHIYRQIDRAHREFSEEQINNIAIISRLRRGKRDKFVRLIDRYLYLGGADEDSAPEPGPLS